MTFADDVDNSYATRFLSSNLKLIIAVTAAAIIFMAYWRFCRVKKLFDGALNSCHLTAINGKQLPAPV